MPVIRRNMGEFRALQKRLEALADPKFVDALTKRMGAAAIKQMDDQYRESRDPYGKPWAPVNRTRAKDRKAKASRARRGLPFKADQPLVDSGRMKAASIAETSNKSGGSTVRVSIPVEYASYHQEGTKHIKQRQIVPDEAGGLGDRWGRAMEREAEKLIREVMKK